MDKKSMLEAMISHYANGNKAKFATFLGVSAQAISAWTARNTFDVELIYTKCSYISADWLLSGEGSMLRSDQAQSALQPIAQPVAQADSPSEAAIYYKMYKEEKAEKESKVEELTAKMLQMAEEIGNLKAQIGNQPSAKAPEHPPLAFDGGFVESFTSESSGGSIKDSAHTRNPTTSLKKSSAGKM